MRSRGAIRFGPASLVAAVALTWARSSFAVDVTHGDDPVRLDVTETSIVAQHFNARGGESPLDQGYGDWLNRLNLALSYGRFTFGARLDSSYYWLRPIDGTLPAGLETRAAADETSRYRNALYPAKLWITYSAPGLEITAGDSYAQFGRGLILSMRKVDELGLDTTIRGAKVAWRSDPFAATLVAGLANPNRVDEATGRALFLPFTAPNQPLGARPLYGSDRIVGAEIQAGRGSPVVLSSHAVHFARCAPYHYDADGRVVQGSFLDPGIGSCDAADTSPWLSTLGNTANGPLLDAREITMVGQALEVPDIAGHGQLYLEVAAQDSDRTDARKTGNAFYASASANAGPMTETLEIKSYRNFYPVPGAVDVTHAAEFNNVFYSTPPTAELITQDSEFGFFSACVDGGRLRSDLRVNKSLLFYLTASYFHSKSEQVAGGCDAMGHTVVQGGVPPTEGVQDYVEDVLAGTELTFDDAQSHLFAWAGVRNDTYQNGDPFYREGHIDYAFTKHLQGPFSLEIQGRHRVRFEQDQNANAYWNEGENYTALKIAPKWVITQGVEYTTLVGQPNLYFNGQLLYRLTGGSNIKLFVGQQRAGLKCVSGVCKLFPAFEGARVELTLRF